MGAFYTFNIIIISGARVSDPMHTHNIMSVEQKFFCLFIDHNFVYAQI